MSVATEVPAGFERAVYPAPLTPDPFGRMMGAVPVLICCGCGCVVAWPTVHAGTCVPNRMARPEPAARTETPT